jgi:hypothetical protein
MEDKAALETKINTLTEKWRYGVSRVPQQQNRVTPMQGIAGDGGDTTDRVARELFIKPRKSRRDVGKIGENELAQIAFRAQIGETRGTMSSKDQSALEGVVGIWQPNQEEAVPWPHVDRGFAEVIAARPQS